MLSRRKTNRKEGPMEKNINDMPEEEKVEKDYQNNNCNMKV